MSPPAWAICFSIVLLSVVGCHGPKDRSPAQSTMIVGRWETTETDPAQRTIWEFTQDGKVTGSSGPAVAANGTFKFLDNDTMEITWNGMEMEKVTFKVKVTKDELEHRVVSINLGDGKLPAEGPITRMKRAKP